MNVHVLEYKVQTDCWVSMSWCYLSRRAQWAALVESWYSPQSPHTVHWSVWMQTVYSQWWYTLPQLMSCTAPCLYGERESVLVVRKHLACGSVVTHLGESWPLSPVLRQETRSPVWVSMRSQRESSHSLNKKILRVEVYCMTVMQQTVLSNKDTLMNCWPSGWLPIW